MWYGSAITSEKRLRAICGAKKAAPVNMMGAVSPATLPTLNMIPVITVGAAAGSTTLRMVCHFEAPRAYEASR